MGSTELIAGVHTISLSKSNRLRLIVGIDYGTTFSGISFVTTDRSSIEDIHVITQWPGQGTSSAWKVPTRIAYSAENKDYEEDTGEEMLEDYWGYSVHPSMISCSWTKLLLDEQPQVGNPRDSKVDTPVEEGNFRLPFRKSAPEVCQDFLAKVYRHMISEIGRQIGDNVLSATPMDCWLTVPAVWSDRAQELTKRAARAAGFGSRPGDHIYIISEPEAAAVATLKRYMHPSAPNPPRQGENILICDCGGGTVDITTYSIERASPTLVFDELCVGIGDKCGSTFIDRNLHSMMHHRFGKHFDDIEPRRKGPGSRFMEQWERVKRNFGMSETMGREELGPLNMPGVPRSTHYDPSEGMVLLTKQDIEMLFIPVVDQIIDLVAEQVTRVAHLGKKIDRLILIGGFGDSLYLNKRVKAWCSGVGIESVLCPPDPQAAIVRGAALRGLEGTAPRKKRCRRHYGVAIRRTFRDGIDPEERACYNEFNNAKLCSGRMKWIIRKGDQVSRDEKRSIDLSRSYTKGQSLQSEIRLYSCSLEEPPDYEEDDRLERVGTIRTDYTDADKSSFHHKRKGFSLSKMWDMKSSIEVNFGARSGSLDFKSLVCEKVTGTTCIEFD